MRLCRRHGWVRASLQSGELSMTAAAQLETTFAGVERAERQCRTGRRNVSAGASPRRAPNKTRPAAAAAEPAQGANESSRRAPNKTRAAAAPAAPAQRGGGNTPAPPGDTAATEKQNPITMLANAASPRQSAPAALVVGPRAGGAPWAAPAAAAPQFAGGASADGADAGAGVSARRSPLRRRSRHWACPLTADRAAHQPGQRAAPRPMAPIPAPPRLSRRSPPRHRSRHSACPLTADRAAPRPGQRSTRPASAAATNPRHGATLPRLSGATSGYATEDAAVIAIRSPGAAAPLPICCRSTTCCRSPRAVARSRTISSCNAEPGVMRSCET